MKRPKDVDAYIAGHPEDAAALEKLRGVLLATELEECIKWGAPCYTIDGKNVVGLAAFKSYVGLWFHQGVFLEDPHGVLVNAQEGKTKALREWRFHSLREIKVTQVRAYVREAIAKQREGKSMPPAVPSQAEVLLPDELEQGFAQHKRAAAAFDKLTPGRQREYAKYVAEAKRSETRSRRVTKILPMIEAGVGLHDKYRSC